MRFRVMLQETLWNEWGEGCLIQSMQHSWRYKFLCFVFVFEPVMPQFPVILYIALLYGNVLSRDVFRTSGNFFFLSHIRHCAEMLEMNTPPPPPNRIVSLSLITNLLLSPLVRAQPCDICIKHAAYSSCATEFVFPHARIRDQLDAVYLFVFREQANIICVKRTDLNRAYR